MIDLIGDVHGHADKLKELLIKLGYSYNENHYSHPDRKVLFVGDYIDRGPKIRETLEIVKQMVDNGSAIALMGNHEYNALCFHNTDTDGKYLREHSEKNIIQHRETIEQFNGKQDELEMYLEWFKTLPLFYETETFRAVHACWDYKSIEYLKKHLKCNCLTNDLICQSVKENTPLYKAIENTLKGKEVRIPYGKSFRDKDGNERSEMRIKWWEDPTKMTYKNISMHPIADLSKEVIDLSAFEDNDYYDETDKCIFFGHYWLKGKPSLFKDNLCCLDYSVAKGGYLTAYSFDGEINLNEHKFNYV